MPSGPTVAGRCGTSRWLARTAVLIPGAGAAHAVNDPYAVTSVNAHFVSMARIDGHGRSMVRNTFTTRTPPSATTTWSPERRPARSGHQHQPGESGPQCVNAVTHQQHCRRHREYHTDEQGEPTPEGRSKHRSRHRVTGVATSGRNRGPR